MTCRTVRAAILLASLVTVGEASLPAANAAQTFADLMAFGLSRATGAAIPPGETGRIFVTEQWTGNIRVVDLMARTVLPTPLLNINVAIAPERGVLGLAFDPKFSENGYFYVNHTGPDGNTRIERFQMQGDPATSNIADPASRHTLLTIAQPQENHNGGWLEFGPRDGYLYISTGDGGGGFDHGTGHTPDIGNAQDITDNLLGKILRIDVTGDDFPNDDLRNYSIPQDNPFVDKEGDDEIWAYGLRNPWRAGFDRKTGDLWIGDVGQDDREEIDFLPADHPGGANFGWRLREGTIPTPIVGGPAPPGAIDPVYEYPHQGDPDFTGGAVTGGYVYRGPVPEFQGMYFFSDTNNGNIWTLDPHAIDIYASVQTLKDKLPRSDTGTFLGQLPSFIQDAVGNFYTVQLMNPSAVFRIATHAKDATWNGNDPSAGAPGNGTSWTTSANWSRDGVADTAFVAEDHVHFASGSTQPSIDLEGEQLVSAATFNASYTLQNGTLRIISGNVNVSADVTATIESDLIAETVHRSIRKLGPGTLLVNGNAGQTVVIEGTLGGSGTLDHLTGLDGSTVAPGAPIGVLTVDESFTMREGATLQIELNGTDNSDPMHPQYDQLMVGGMFNAAGTLEVRLFDDGAEQFAPANGDTFAIVTAEDGITGEFDEMILPTLGAALNWEIDRSSGDTLVLRASSILPGDYNANGSVDAADYIVWRDTLGRSEGPLAADGSGPNGERDGVVDQWDYEFWRSNFGAAIDDPVGQASSVIPEPTAAMLAAMSAAALSTRRRTARVSNRAGRRTARG
jgi:glucose/arabinose dehydrogenase